MGKIYSPRHSCAPQLDCMERACDLVAVSKLFRFVNVSIKFKSTHEKKPTDEINGLKVCSTMPLDNDIDTKLNHTHLNWYFPKAIEQHLLLLLSPQPPPPWPQRARKLEVSISIWSRWIKCVELCVMNYWMNHLTECRNQRSCVIT